MKSGKFNAKAMSISMQKEVWGLALLHRTVRELDDSFAKCVKVESFAGLVRQIIDLVQRQPLKES